ncbi:HNH endonuclease signature motif containing protein [Corynebacterium sp.]|uniref:HNH endonuclease signature motif containing protein n=1 Tax=Corynebacterium sp. TaxID=1720 RepID=UPI002A91120D|nr:HNH endonuclease signature motif containing protein [Corynebacterium sp.]MDY5785727.1 HNH endonuclease signature motif containing protein [Corynebacterium sp.]
MSIATELTNTSPQHLVSLIESGFGLITRNKAKILYAIALVDALRIASQLGARSTAGWLIRNLSVSHSTAHEYVKAGRAMLEFSVMADAFLEGRINYSKVRLMLPYLTEHNEADIVALAEEMRYHELELALLQFRDNPGPRKRESYVRMKARNDGRIGLWADFNAEEGAKLMAAMKVGELAWRDIDLDNLSGEDGLVDPAAVDRELDCHAASSVSRFGLPLREALLGSFMGLVNIALTRPSNPLRAPGAHVNVVMTTDGRAYLPNNPGAPSEAIKNFLSNAEYRVNRVDETGLVINTGRRFRLANDAQINALMFMWRGECAIPGCDHSRFMEMHHIRDWADGGTTDLDNLLPLCSACHSLVSDGFITILEEAGDIHFLFPDGSRYVSRDRGLPVRDDNALTLEEFNVETTPRLRA